MEIEYNISIYLDKRRIKVNGKYPVKLGIFGGIPRIQKHYPTKFEFTKEEFKKVWVLRTTPREFKEIRRKIDARVAYADSIAEKIVPFTFESFEKKFLRNKNDGIKINYHYEQTIHNLNLRGQVGNSSNYNLSKKSLAEFAKEKKKQAFEQLNFSDITADWLLDYEKYMIDEKKRSLTTVSIYVRSLRAIFNKAIEDKEFSKETHYPFGKKRYSIPATKNVKKALSKEQLKALFNLAPETPEQEKAKDFWFFSYSCNGMNIKDISILKNKDIKDDQFEFLRAKTITTSKTNLKVITVYLNDFTKKIIEKYGNSNNAPNNYVFNILTTGLTPQQQQAKIKNFTRMINQNLKKLCKANNLPEKISTYWARHSYATNAIRKGATMEFVQESLGHGDLKTTQSYFAGFDDESKKEFANTVMDFD